MKNRWALITGGSKGIGWAIAKKFAKEGINIMLSSRHIEDLKNCQNEIKTINSDIDCMVFQADVSQKSEVKLLAEFVKGQVEYLDILINNAGVFLPGSVLDEKDGQLEMQIETNLYSAYYLTRALIDTIKAADRGYILNMCSIASFMAYPGGGSYSISKFAMLGWSKTLRAELLDSNVAVTSIMPGATWSASWAGADLERQRIIEPDNIAELCWTIINLDTNAVVEELIIRPQKGDL